MIKSNLVSGEEISIEGDLFEVIKKTDRRKSLGCYEYNLKPAQEDIISGNIYYFNSEKIILELVRSVDCQIKGRTIQYKGQLYQISKEYDDVHYDNESNSMVRDHIYELRNLKESMIGELGPKKIVVNKDDNKVFYDFREITMNEFSEPKKVEEEKRIAETISFKYTFKEPVG